MLPLLVSWIVSCQLAVALIAGRATRFVAGEGGQLVSQLAGVGLQLDLVCTNPISRRLARLAEAPFADRLGPINSQQLAI